MLTLLLLHWSTLPLGLALPYSYPSQVAVNPCGIPYPLKGLLGSERSWRYQPVRTLRWRVSSLVHLIKFKKDFEEFKLDLHTWIPDDSSFSNIGDVATGLPTINRSLKYFSVAFDILEPHYSGRIPHTCKEAVENFESLYANHTMLICETDEAMRAFGINPTMDYPTLNVDVPEKWAKINPEECTVNNLFSVAVLKKYKHFLFKFENLLEQLVNSMAKTQ